MKTKLKFLKPIYFQIIAMIFIILSTSNSFSGAIEYKEPKVEGYALDVCREWGQNCGRPAADAYCRSKGHDYAMGYTVIHNKPPTRIINGNQVCSEPFCARITWIKCKTNVPIQKNNSDAHYNFSKGQFSQRKLNNNKLFYGPIDKVTKIGSGKWVAKWDNGENGAPWKITISIDGKKIRIDEHHSNQVWNGILTNNGNKLVGKGKEKGGKYSFQIELQSLAQDNSGKDINTLMPKNKNDKHVYLGEWRGNTWCSNPTKSKKSFRFDIWIKNNAIICDDHSANNKFRPGVIAADGSLHCSWYRTNSDANGTYVFYPDKNDSNLLLGYENTQNTSCKQYRYEMRRENEPTLAQKNSDKDLNMLIEKSKYGKHVYLGESKKWDLETGSHHNQGDILRYFCVLPDKDRLFSTSIMVSSGDYELLAFDAKFNFLAIAKPTPGFVHRKLLPDISSKYRGIYFVVHCKKKGQFQLFIKTLY